MIFKLSTTLNGENRIWPVEELPLRIGRSSSNFVQVLDSSVSREHAELARDGARITVRFHGCLEQMGGFALEQAQLEELVGLVLQLDVDLAAD